MISSFYKYSWFADLAYVSWDDTNSADANAWIRAAADGNNPRIPGKREDDLDADANTLGERVFYPVADGGLGWQLLSFHPDSASGFAASLYGDGSEKVLAIRGTSPLLGADGKPGLWEIGLRGMARA